MKLVLNRKRLADGGQMVEAHATFNSANELMIYDYIMPYTAYDGDTSVTPNQVQEFMKNAPAELTVRINSSGGDVGSALAIYNTLVEHGNVTTIVDGYAFSSAGWLALAGNNRQICNGGLFMMHNPWTYALINSEESIEQARGKWVAHRDSIVNIFKDRTELNEDEIRNMLQAETYLGAQDAVKKGLFHSVRNTTASTAMLNYVELPASVRNMVDIPRPDVQALTQRMLNIRRKMSISS